MGAMRALHAGRPESSSDSEAGDSDTSSISSLQDSAADASSLAVRVRLTALGLLQIGARAWGRALHPFWIPLLSSATSAGPIPATTMPEPRSLLSVVLNDPSAKVRIQHSALWTCLL